MLARLLRGAPQVPRARHAALRRLWEPESDRLLDEALILRFEEGASYTGEASAELHIHGGVAVRRALETALENAGARMAEPGEFSRRAHLAGRLDLAQAEAVAALIEAESEAQRRQALEILDGAVGRQAALWREELIAVAALLETGIDFVEEGIDEMIAHEVKRRLAELRESLETHVAHVRGARSASEKPVIALIGLPNAGKSSLLNAVLERDAAIVSAQAGTTRDAVTGEIEIGDAVLRVMDTAGIRESDDEIEQIGVGRARTLAERADLRILVVSADSGRPSASVLELLQPEDAIFWTKADIERPSNEALDDLPAAQISIVSTRDSSAASAFDALVQARNFGARLVGSPIGSSKRRADLIRGAITMLERAEAGLQQDHAELAAEECRAAAEYIAQLVGDIHHEDVLDALFGRFCIGK